MKLELMKIGDATTIPSNSVCRWKLDRLGFWIERITPTEWTVRRDFAAGSLGG